MDKIESKKMTGKEIKNHTLAGIGMVDVPFFRDYLNKKGINYEIYRYKKNHDEGLLDFLDGRKMQTQTFRELVSGNKCIEGGFWSDSTVLEDTEIEKI